MKLFLEDSFNRKPFLLPMILICLAAFLYSYISEIGSLVWLVATIVFALIYFWQRKLNPYCILFVLFFFAWYRIGISRENDKQFQFPIELNQKIIEVNGTVISIDSLDIQQTFLDKRQISFLMEVTDNNIWHDAKFIKVQVQENSSVGVLPGEVISVTGRFFIPFDKSVPGAFDSKLYYSENKYLGNLKVKSWGAIEKKGTTLTWRKWVYLGRKIVYDKLKSTLSPNNSGLIASVVLGYTLDLDNEIMVEFRQWGIAHIFSISGLHLGLVGFWVWLISGFFIISLKKRTLLTILIAFIYCLMSGMAVATVRSLIMLVCFLAGYLVNRRTSMWNNFSIAFVLLFIWDPRYVYSAGFQLSFVAVAGILITQEILSRNKKKEGIEIISIDSRRKLIAIKLGESLFYPMMISAAALGVTAYHFQMVSFGSVFLNFLVVPLFSIIMGMSFFYLFFLFFIPHWMIWPLEKICDLFMYLPGKITGGSGLFTYVHAPAPWVIVLMFLVFCGIALLKISFKKTCLIYILYFFLIQCFLIFQGEPPKNRLVMINVGSASSCLVQNISGENLLFDCGTFSGYDIISPYLRSEGINQLQAVVISHDNFDHFSCWSGIYKNFKVHRVWRNLSQISQTIEITTMDTYCLQAEIPISNAYIGEQINFGTKNFNGEILHPGKEIYSSKNNESMVVLLSTEWCEVLFPGDAQEILELVMKKELAAKSKPRILIFPHHGRNFKDTEKLLKWFEPDLILISGNIVSEEIKEVLLKSNIKWFLTSESGTIQVEPDLKIKTYNQGKWSAK